MGWGGLGVVLALGAVCIAQPRNTAASAAQAAAQQGDYLAAEQQYRAALKHDPKNIALWNGLGVALNRQSRYLEAADAFRTALRLDPSIRGIQLNVGIALFRAGNLAEAADALQPLADEPQARSLLAMAYAGLEKFDLALPILEELAVSSTDPAIHIALAGCYSRLGRPADVAKTMSHMFQVVPDDAALHMALAGAYDRENDIERALAEYGKAAAMDARLTHAHLHAGRLLWRERRFDEAEREFLDDLKADPASAEAKYYLGTTYLYRDEPARAIPLLDEFVKARSGEKNGFLELGRALMQQRQTHRAIWAFERAAALDPADASLHYQLGRAYKTSGRDLEAKRELDLSKRLASAQAEKIGTEIRDIGSHQ